MSETIEELKKENEDLRKQLSEINGSVEISAFYSLRKMLSQQTKRLYPEIEATTSDVEFSNKE